MSHASDGRVKGPGVAVRAPTDGAGERHIPTWAMGGGHMDPRPTARSIPHGSTSAPTTLCIPTYPQYSLASGSLDTVDSGAPQAYTWRDVRCSYEQRGSGARGSKPVEVEVRCWDG